MRLARYEFGPEIATVNVAYLRGLGKVTMALINDFAQPRAFALEGDMQTVARLLVPDMADYLTLDDLPSLSGQATADGEGYGVAARLPSKRSATSLPTIADLSYVVYDESQIERRPGWPRHAPVHITRASLTRRESNSDKLIHPDAAVRGVTWALGRLRKRPLPDGAHWNI